MCAGQSSKDYLSLDGIFADNFRSFQSMQFYLTRGFHGYNFGVLSKQN
jgi:hypothetical protein